MVLSAIGMKPPGFASAAPGTYDRDNGRARDLAHLVDHAVETLRIRWPPQNPDDPDDEQDRGDYVPIATQVFGCDGVLEAARSRSTNAATIPITSVALRAPT